VEKKPLYTIGHGSRKSEDLLALLKEYGIELLVDAAPPRIPGIIRNSIKTN